jgi:low temperature requirement protein LtrA
VSSTAVEPDAPVGTAGKRVSWVELYLDLVFVLAVGQLSHLIVHAPLMRSVWIALGLFATLWWTWIGFAVLYNRRGADEPGQRLLYLAGSVPAGVAAVAIDPAAEGHATVFALSLAATRVVLAVANASDGGLREGLGRRVTRSLLFSVGLLVVSVWIPGPLRYVLWGIAIAVESGALLTDDREAKQRFRHDHDLSALAPVDPAERLDAHHFAERFGLFIIILLGEVVISAGQTSADAHVEHLSGWAALVAAMVLAATLWWLYFDAAAEINLRVLELSGGSPVMARGIFAVGHMFPAFALLLVAAGTGLLLEGDPPRLAHWLPCIGIGTYLVSTRVTLVAASRVATGRRFGLVVATFFLGFAGRHLSAHAYLWLLTAWTLGCAVLATRGTREAQAAGRGFRPPD